MKALLGLVLLICAAPGFAQTLTITNAHLLDGERDEAGVTIVLQGGTIASVVRGGAVPQGAQVIDADGRPVTPALAAAATQIGVIGMGGATNTEDSAVTSSVLGGAFDISRAVDPDALTIQEARAQGVGTAMVFPTQRSGAFGGSGALLDLDPQRALVKERQAAVFATSSPASSGGSRAAAWSLIRNALAEARKPADPANRPRDDLLGPAEIDALRPVLARRIPLAIHASRKADIREAIALSSDFGIRVVVLGGAEAWRLAGELARAQVSVVIDPLDALPFSYESVGARRDNAAILAKAGIPIAFMVSGQTVYLSYNVGAGLREGAGIAAANGLPRGDAVRAITSGSAQVWSGKASPGLVAGAPADLVIWDGDPLEPASAPASVILGGKPVSLVTRQTMLRDRYHPRRNDDPLPPAYR
jgi:imidazolonepropionase-like amidohydrolase